MKINTIVKKGIIIGAITLFIGAAFTTSLYGSITPSEDIIVNNSENMERVIEKSTQKPLLDELYYYDLINDAQEAVWEGLDPFNPPELLDFGIVGDPNGYAHYVEPAVLEDGYNYDRVLETHPRWVDGGGIRGTMPPIKVGDNTELYLSVGFLSGATATDGVEFWVAFMEDGSPTYAFYESIFATYDGVLNETVFSLEPIWGLTGSFIMGVNATGTATHDWAAWNDAVMGPMEDITVYDFIDNAANMEWESWSPVHPREPLPWPGSEADPLGFALYRDYYVMEDGETYDRVLETHPRWVTDGAIGGTDYDRDVPYGSGLYLSVGFLEGAVGSDGVTFKVWFNETYSSTPELVAIIISTYDGRLDYEMNSLADYWGHSGDFTLEAYAGASSGQDWAVWVEAELRIFRVIEGDFSYTTPVLDCGQVLWGTRLIEGKATVFRINVTSTFPVAVSTHISLELPDDEWTKSPVSLGRMHIGVPPSYRYPEIWGPITLDPGWNEIILPYIPPGMEDAPWSMSSNPAGVLDAGKPDALAMYSGWGPDSRVVPRPKDSTVSAEVHLDAYDRLLEDDEANNDISDSYTVVTTKKFNFAVWPTREGEVDVFGTINNDCDEGTGNPWDPCEPACVGDLTPNFNSVVDAFKSNFNYFVSAYPIAETKAKYTLLYTYTTYDSSSESRGGFLSRIYSASRRHYDWAVAVTCGCCGGCVANIPGGGDKNVVAIGNSTVNWHNLAHEAAHVILGAPDCYGCDGPPRPDCITCKSDEGFYVNEWLQYPDGSAPWTNGCYYMTFSNYAPHCWVKLNSTEMDDGTPFTDGYNAMIDALLDPADPEGILVRGIFNEDETMELHPFLRISNTTLDIYPEQIGGQEEEGRIYIELRDVNDQPLSKSSFKPVFSMTAREPYNGSIPVNESHFAFVIEWLEGAASIIFRDTNYNIYATRAVSNNPPDVTVQSPNGGETYAQGDQIPVTWSANDIDTDSLTYTISLVKDYTDEDNRSWYPLDIDVPDTQFIIDTSRLPPGSYRISIEASDGVYTTEDISDDDFIIFDPSLCGDANSDGIINVSDVVFIINYIFIPNFPAPDPLCSANVNGDATVNVSDAVYLINYIFVPGSPGPVSNCCQ